MSTSTTFIIHVNTSNVNYVYNTIIHAYIIHVNYTHIMSTTYIIHVNYKLLTFDVQAIDDNTLELT